MMLQSLIETPRIRSAVSASSASSKLMLEAVALPVPVRLAPTWTVLPFRGAGPRSAVHTITIANAWAPATVSSRSAARNSNRLTPVAARCTDAARALMHGSSSADPSVGKVLAARARLRYQHCGGGASLPTRCRSPQDGHGPTSVGRSRTSKSRDVERLDVTRSDSSRRTPGCSRQHAARIRLATCWCHARPRRAGDRRVHDDKEFGAWPATRTSSSARTGCSPTR